MLYSEYCKVATRLPDKPAVICGERSMTYRELLLASQHVGRALREIGVSRGDPVMLLLPNGIDLVCATLGLLGIQAVCVPVNTRFPADEIKFYLENAEVGAILHNGEFRELLADLAPECAQFFTIDGEIRPGRLPGRALRHRSAAQSPDPAATYMYSSGSTGKPKRVTRTQGQWCAEYAALAPTIGLSEADTILCTIPLFHTHGFGNCMMAALLSGATLVILPGEFNVRATVGAVARHRATIFPAVPFMFKMIADSVFRVAPDLSSLRLAFSAGAPLAKETALFFADKYGNPVRQLFGSTETGAVSINHDGGPGTEASVGRPLPGMRVDILDDTGQPLGAGATGEIAIRSPAMTRRYDGMAELTSASFVNGYFLVGDLASKDEDGRIYISGRKKLIINVAGQKVDPFDVESAIRALPWVSDVVVVGQPDQFYGEQVKAVIVPRDAADGGAQQVIEHCARHLAEHKVPRLVEFRREIPKSPLGKILRKYL